MHGDFKKKKTWLKPGSILVACNLLSFGAREDFLHSRDNLILCHCSERQPVHNNAELAEDSVTLVVMLAVGMRCMGWTVQLHVDVELRVKHIHLEP